MPSEDDLNQLRPVFERELRSLGELVKQFAEEWPEAAHLLELDGGMPGDPDMARLLEGVAWLCTRLQVRLDDGYESVCRQLLQLFYPDFIKPVPAMGILQFDCTQLKDLGHLEKHTPFELVFKGVPYHFQTCKSIDLLPVNMASLSMVSEPLPASVLAFYPEMRSGLKLSLCAQDGETELSEYLEKGLELYANPEAVRANEVLDLLFSSLAAILVKTPSGISKLPASCLSWPMFEAGNSLLSSEPGLFEAQRLLRDFFLAPDLFRFLHIDLSTVIESLTGPEADIWLLLDESSAGLEKDVGPDHFRIGCVPVANLYEVWADPMHMNHQVRDVPIQMGQLYQGTRVHKVLSVRDVTNPDKPVPLPSIFQASYGERFGFISWQAVHSASSDCLQFKDARASDDRVTRVLGVQCLGYDPDAGGLSPSAMLRPSGAALPCNGRLLKNTTLARTEGLVFGDSWKLLSALQLNIRSLQMNKEEAESLRKILSVFVREQSGVSRKLLYAIESLICTREVRPCRSGQHYFVSQGSCFQLRLDSEKLGSIPAAMFLSLLDQVLNFWRPFGSHSRVEARFQLSGSGAEKQIIFPVRNDG